MRAFVLAIICIGIAVGFGTQLPREWLMRILIFRDFFDAAIPILAFGALIKYLCSPCFKCGTCHKKECEDKTS
jgi:hypothetical protein